MKRYQRIPMVLGVPLLVMLTLEPFAFARESQFLSEERVAEDAKGAWENGAINSAMDILDQGIQDNPDALTLHKLRGDVLATSRRPHEAVEAYESVLARKPTALDVRWAKWSVLMRSGQELESIAELQRIAQVDVQNPLIHLRLAQELRKLDRLEESVESYKKAVQLVPDLLSWRLGLARAYFDVLDYPAAYEEVQYVLQRVPPGSPLELPAKNLLSVITGSGRDRGRRFTRVYTPDATPEQLKEWALIRGDAWRLFAAGRYAEAEPRYRRLLALNPRDPTAAHQLGLILMELGRCEEALPFFRQMSTSDASDEEQTDAIFRTGQCLVELEQWSEALVYFQVLYEAAVEFEERNKNVQHPPGTRVLD
ncbi:MAG: tetratricopeptide repeat protein, partial [Nitrospiraceae bacterium]